jgi:hypothetical protein
MSVSKSMFSNSLVPLNRSLYNPIYQQSKGTDLVAMNTEFIKTLQTIQEFYVKNMALKQYEKIPGDYQKYIALYVTLQQVIMKTPSPQLRLLFTIAQEALVGAINSYSIYGDNVLLKLDKTNLQNKINDILTKKNEKLLEIPTTNGQLSVKKTFKLAPVFNNYILVYGLPPYGVGFDQVKIDFLANVLRKKGINPYK